MSGTTIRYNKMVFQLEKGLSPNTIVPKLKQRVDSMKDKVRTDKQTINISAYFILCLFIYLFAQKTPITLAVKKYHYMSWTKSQINWHLLITYNNPSHTQQIKMKKVLRGDANTARWL